MSMETLAALALVTSIVSMLFSCAALWPVSRESMSAIRDLVLWTAMIFLMAGAASVAWRFTRAANAWPDGYRTATPHWPATRGNGVGQPVELSDGFAQRAESHSSAAGQPSRRQPSGMYGSEAIHGAIQLRDET